MHDKQSNHLAASVPFTRTHAPAKNRGALGELRAAIKDGWQIVQPIFARPLWSSLNDEQTALHFVLQRERATRLLTLHESKSVLRFIRERDLAIDQRRGK